MIQQEYFSTLTAALFTGTVGITCETENASFALNSSTCYRVYFWAATATTGTLRIDNMVINAVYQNTATYQWYNVDPVTNPAAAPIATGNAYDPMTTLATSPDTVWVTCINANGCEHLLYNWIY